MSSVIDTGSSTTTTVEDVPSKRTLVWTAITGAFLFLTAGSWVLIANRLPFDRPLHRLAVETSDRSADSVARAVTHLGDAPIMYAVAALVTLLLLLHRDWLEASVMGFGMLATVAFVRLGKSIVGRHRPSDQIANALGHSFPSGHSAYAFSWVVIGVIAVRVIPQLRGRRWPIVLGALIAVTVPITRVYLRAHWASDTIAGAGEAMMSFSLVALVAMAIANRRKAAAA